MNWFIKNSTTLVLYYIYADENKEMNQGNIGPNEVKELKNIGKNESMSIQLQNDVNGESVKEFKPIQGVTYTYALKGIISH